ncbi:hypothetical protein FOA52_015747 [Chlamydomonas sp. UWO 241]|nr:hypothetical protein FOA52_015747 [Chlamydomonas sp. UWO 241]
MIVGGRRRTRGLRLPRQCAVTVTLLLVLLALLECTRPVAADSCPVYKWSWVTSTYIGTAAGAGTQASGDYGCNDANGQICTSGSTETSHSKCHGLCCTSDGYCPSTQCEFNQVGTLESTCVWDSNQMTVTEAIGPCPVVDEQPSPTATSYTYFAFCDYAQYGNGSFDLGRIRCRDKTGPTGDTAMSQLFLETGWRVAAGGGRTLSANQSVGLRESFATYLFGSADAYEQIDYLGTTFVEDYSTESPGTDAAARPQQQSVLARRHLLQGGSAGTLLVHMLTMLPSSQVQQSLAALSLGYTSGALGAAMVARGLPRPTVLNMGEETTGGPALGGAGLSVGAASFSGSPHATQTSSASAFVMAVSTCCVCLAVVVAVLGHVSRSSSRSPPGRARDLADDVVGRAAKRHNWSLARVAMVSRLLDTADAQNTRGRSRACRAAAANAALTAQNEAVDVNNARTRSDQELQHTAGKSKRAGARMEGASTGERPDLGTMLDVGRGSGNTPEALSRPGPAPCLSPVALATSAASGRPVLPGSPSTSIHTPASQSQEETLQHRITVGGVESPFDLCRRGSLASGADFSPPSASRSMLTPKPSVVQAGGGGSLRRNPLDFASSPPASPGGHASMFAAKARTRLNPAYSHNSVSECGGVARTVLVAAPTLPRSLGSSRLHDAVAGPTMPTAGAGGSHAHDAAARAPQLCSRGASAPGASVTGCGAAPPPLQAELRQPCWGIDVRTYSLPTQAASRIAHGLPVLLECPSDSIGNGTVAIIEAQGKDKDNDTAARDGSKLSGLLFMAQAQQIVSLVGVVSLLDATDFVTGGDGVGTRTDVFCGFSCVAAVAAQHAADGEAGVSLPVRLATNLVRFVHDASGRWHGPAGGGVVSASFLNAKPAVGGIGVEPRGGGVLRVLFTVTSDAVADTVVRWRRSLRQASVAVFDVLSDREEAQHQALWPAFLAAKAAGKRAQFHRARLVVDGERVAAPVC